jgi:hypothetical protein
MSKLQFLFYRLKAVYTCVFNGGLWFDGLGDGSRVVHVVQVRRGGEVLQAAITGLRRSLKSQPSGYGRADGRVPVA